MAIAVAAAIFGVATEPGCQLLTVLFRNEYGAVFDHKNAKRSYPCNARNAQERIVVVWQRFS